MKKIITALLICCMVLLMGAKAVKLFESAGSSSYVAVTEEYSVANDNDKTQEG